MKMKLPYFVRASVYYLLLVSVIAVRTAFARMFSLCIASVCAHAISAPLCLWFCLVLFSSVSHLGVCPLSCVISLLSAVVWWCWWVAVWSWCGAKSVCYFESVLNFVLSLLRESFNPDS